MSDAPEVRYQIVLYRDADEVEQLGVMYDGTDRDEAVKLYWSFDGTRNHTECPGWLGDTLRMELVANFGGEMVRLSHGEYDVTDDNRRPPIRVAKLTSTPPSAESPRYEIRLRWRLAPADDWRTNVLVATYDRDEALAAWYSFDANSTQSDNIGDNLALDFVAIVGGVELDFMLGRDEALMANHKDRAVYKISNRRMRGEHRLDKRTPDERVADDKAEQRAIDAAEAFAPAAERLSQAVDEFRQAIAQRAAG
jgi:hypothetical protein